LLQGAVDRVDRFLGVAEKHGGLRVFVERVVDAGEPRFHRTFEHDDVFGFVDVEDRHAEDR
jgi:hypothetical protein